MQTPIGAVTCSRDRAGTPARSRWPGRPSPRCPGLLSVGGASRSPGRVGRTPHPRRLQEGAEFPGAADSSPRQRGLTGQPTRAWGCAAGLVGRAGHGQPLRGGGGRLPGPGVPQQKGTWRRLRRSGQSLSFGEHRGSPATSAPSGRETAPCLLPASELRGKAPLSWPEWGFCTAQDPFVSPPARTAAARPGRSPLD